jgi:hypothetical protein
MRMNDFEDYTEERGQAFLDYLEHEKQACGRIWPYCGADHLFPGVCSVTAYTCRECGQAASASGSNAK